MEGKGPTPSQSDSTRLVNTNMSKKISDQLTSINLEKPVMSTLAQKGDESLVQLFLTENVKVSGEEKDTARSQLYMASFWGIYDAVKSLIENGAGINCQNPNSLWTPLHAASFQEHGKIVMFLLDSKADPLLEDSEGRSPVDFASASDKIWPLFAVRGYTRTTKVKLLQKGILRQPPSSEYTSNENINMDMNNIRKEKSILPINYNSPSTQPKYTDRNAYAASVDGDVLAGDTLSKAANEEVPHFNTWRN